MDSNEPDEILGSVVEAKLNPLIDIVSFAIESSCSRFQSVKIFLFAHK